MRSLVQIQPPQLIKKVNHMSNSEVIWESKLDDKWDCSVIRLTESTGRLVVCDDKETILNERVSLSYGAMFGPDIADVTLWQDMCVDIVDKYQMD